MLMGGPLSAVAVAAVVCDKQMGVAGIGLRRPFACFCQPPGCQYFTVTGLLISSFHALR